MSSSFSLTRLTRSIVLALILGAMARLAQLKYYRSKVNKLYPGMAPEHPATKFDGFKAFLRDLIGGDLFTILRSLGAKATAETTGLGFVGFVSRLHIRSGGMVRFWMSPRTLALSFQSPLMHRQVLRNFPDRHPLSQPLFLSSEALWSESAQSVHKEIQTWCSAEETRRLMHGNAITTALSSIPNWHRGNIDPNYEMSEIAYSVVGSSIFGASTWAGNAGAKIRTLHQSVLRMEETRRHVSLLNADIPFEVLSKHPSTKEYVQANDSFNEAIQGLVKDRRASLGIQVEDTSSATTVSLKKITGSGGGDDLITSLSKRSDLSDENVARAVLSAFHFGVKSTRITLTWCLYHLCVYPEVQDKILTELDNRVGRTVPPSFNDIDGLTYLTAFLLESIRTRPVAPLVERLVVTPDGDYIEGLFVPKDTRVFAACAAGTRYPHQIDSLYKPSGEFSPERFLPTKAVLETGLPVPAQVLVDADKWAEARMAALFGADPRGCPGRALASGELAATLVVFLQKYQVSLAPDSMTLGKLYANDDGLNAQEFRVSFRPRTALRSL